MKTQLFITFFIVQLMFLVVGFVGGAKIGTFDAGALCFLSQAVGVIACIIEYNLRKQSYANKL